MDTAGTQVYTVEEAGRRLGLKRSASYGAVARGDIRVVKIGRRYLVPQQEIDRILSSAQPVGGTAGAQA